MNQLCKVCGEPAAGFHFGAFTCEGCKSFFGRTYNNLSSISECKNNGQCVINKKNRTACKACRLRKCLLVGMSKSGSRYGRRSNWFKIHCLLQEQQQAGANFMAAGLLRPHPYLPLFRNPMTDKSSESDSGASSADPEDDVRSASALSCFRTSPATSESATSCRKLPSPAVAISPDGKRNSFPHDGMRSSFPPDGMRSSFPLDGNRNSFPSAASPGRWMPLQVGDPSTWRDLWLRGPLPVAEPAPEQDQPIDLSVRAQPQTDCVEEVVRPLPLDLTLDRQDVVTN